MEIDFFQNFIHIDEIDSTNNFLKKHYEILPNISTISAGFQTKGRGQFDRMWESDRNKNLLISILFKKYLPSLMKDVNLNIVNIVIDTLKEYGVTDATFKYPNDVFVQNKKIAGILIETKYNDKKFEYIIIGIGININQEKFKTSEAISLRNLIKKEVDLDEFKNKLFKNLSKIIS
ncbi:MAG: biotin--[acetyl-CoA-carboxylase] ligase [Clostridia bacterium]|jgi:biotin-[acetyl-CoA-carboxylase] ligase BirA-like protein|nr:biotin--[acetyl-CoA-carboxylase] ligase [Clostridia bacterium]MDD3231892.1 biotin--[acetyl-CoA-carboxylase] ligase [Clostridia bacterium]MDD3862330.1 biotin--[acetyl-CoA-carboxylase] ligase [Clostridia bacterium]